MTRWRDATAALVQPRVEDEDVREALLVDGTGRGTTFRRCSPRSSRRFPTATTTTADASSAQGAPSGAAFSPTDSTDPCVRLLMRRNADPARRDSSRLIALTSWWRARLGWDIRHDGTFCAPKSGARFLLSKLLEGIPHEPRVPSRIPPGRLSRKSSTRTTSWSWSTSPRGSPPVPGGSETTSAREILERTRGELFVVHRLDMGTSGVLAFAKTKEALRPLNLAFADRTAQKTYIARLEGLLEGEGAPAGLDRTPDRASLVRAPEAVRAARLRRRPRGPHRLRGDRRRGPPEGLKSLVALHPRTGRTHQLRVHCAHPKDSAFPSTATLLRHPRPP